jgi:hypothetical protein
MDDDLVDVVMNKHIGGGDVSSPETKRKQEAETKKKEKKQRTRRGMKRIKDVHAYLKAKTQRPL